MIESKPKMSNTVKEQVLAIHSTGETNMFDIPKIKEIAEREGYSELLDYLEENRNGYIVFILTGKT